MATEITTETSLEERLKKIVSFVESLPEPYRMKCFDILVAELHSTVKPVAEINSNGHGDALLKNKVDTPSTFVLPIDVKAFFQQFNLTPNDALDKLFLIEGSEIRPIYDLNTTKKGTAQVQLALLTALENALKTSKFEFSFEDVRSKCRDRKCYDGSNFTQTFKNNSKFFKGLEDEEHVVLSPEGKQELAETISKIK